LSFANGEESNRRDRRGHREKRERKRRNKKKQQRGIIGLKDYMDRSIYKFLNPCNPLIHVIPI
jgi:hypothetical protein